MASVQPPNPQTNPRPTDNRLYVAGVGVSSAAPMPLCEFLATAGSISNVAFVVVAYGTIVPPVTLVDLVQKQSSLPIAIAQDGQILQAGVVYVAAGGVHVTTVDGQVIIETMTPPNGEPCHVLDTLLISIAETCGEHSIAILLAGDAEDGAAGLRAISLAGGIVLIQSPENNDVVLPAVIEECIADAVLAPTALAGMLQRMLESNQTQTQVEEPELDLTPIFNALRERWGVDFTSYKSTTIRRGILRRLTAQGNQSIDDYLARLVKDPDELDRVYRDLLIRVTEFFRTPEAFLTLETRVLPEIFRKHEDNQEIRVWVAGCATGEEAYSVAILLHEQAHKCHFGGKITVFATDIHRPSLSLASQGIYNVERMQHVSNERRIGYFQELADGSYKVVTELRKMIVFAPQSVISDPPFTRIDLVCCRNLLIYLRPALQEKVITAMHFALRNGGFLFLGVSEGLGRLAHEFVVVDSRLKIFRKARDFKLPLDLAPHELKAVTDPAALLTIARPLVGIERQLLYDYDRLLERYMPTGVLLDAQRRPLHYFGAIARYMQQPQGRAETDFLHMVDPALGLAMSNGIQRAILSNQPITIHGIRIRVANEERWIDLAFERLSDVPGHAAHMIVTFTEHNQQIISPNSIAGENWSENTFERDTEWSQRINELEHELTYTRENLQATIEELQTSNEELQATNEELLAANEELQSVNEGLQSLNEELQSLNAEFELKNNELKELNRDYDDLIRSTRVAILSLDCDLRIRRYSPSIATFFDLQPFDLGRPISSIAYKLDGYMALIENLRQILAGGDEVEREVSIADGRWFQLRTRPIVNEQQMRVGVLLMYIDISELKRAQDLRMCSEQRLRGAIESSTNAFYVFESVRNFSQEIIDFRIMEVNQVGADRFNSQRDLLLGRRLSEIIPSPALNEMVRAYRPVIENDKPLSREHLTNIGTTSRWVQQQVVKVGDGVAVTSADITLQKRYEVEREMQHIRLELALDGGGLGTWEVDLITNTVFSDQRTLALLGFNTDANEMSWDHWRSHIYPDDLLRVNDALAAHLAGEAPNFDLEVRVLLQDGTWRWVLGRGRVVERDTLGRPRMIAGTYMDTTKRVLAEEQLRASERRYQVLSETSPVGIYRADATGSWTYVNPRWCEIVGLPASAALGLGWQEHLYPDDKELVVKYWEEIIAHPRENYLEFRYLRSDGEVCWVLAQVVPEFEEDGSVAGYVGTIININRRIAAENRLRQQSAQLASANEDLARAARLKDQFLANMSHELRTPLTGVIGFSEALNQGIYGDLSPAQQRAVEHIFDNGQHLLNLINDILDLARVGAGQIELKLGPVIVDEVCLEVINLMMPMMKAKSQRFAYTRSTPGLTIEADVLRLRQILINLLSNAVKFTPEGGDLGLQVNHDATAGMIAFSVWDHGIGISPGQQAILFQPFVQLDNRLSRDQTGTGLGLALVQQLTILHGGSINLQSRPNEGSTFTLLLPQQSARMVLDELPMRIASQQNNTTKLPPTSMILLAEDDLSVATFLLDYLSAQGYGTVHVSHGDEVLGMIHSLRPQLALIDIQMPGVSGLEIIARLRADPNQAIARTPIIALTALAMVGDRDRCLAAGADDYLSKPVRLDKLSTIIARTLSIQHE